MNVGGGVFAAPNTAAIMSSVPAEERGAASGVRSTFFNAGSALSIGVFFSLMIAGLAATLPRTLSAGLRAQGVPAHVATQVSHLMNGGGNNTINLNKTTSFSSIALADSLTGGNGTDFFLGAVASNSFSDVVNGETVTDIEG